MKLDFRDCAIASLGGRKGGRVYTKDSAEKTKISESYDRQEGDQAGRFSIQLR
jgi:hypothetical protein